MKIKNPMAACAAFVVVAVGAVFAVAASPAISQASDSSSPVTVTQALDAVASDLAQAQTDLASARAALASESQSPAPSSPVASPTAIPSSPVASVPVSPSPTATAAPSGCLAAPSACGFPDATNTGVPAGTPLTVHAGKLVVTTDGAVIENEEIQGCLQVKAANVTIRNVLIDGGCLYSLDLSNATGHTDVTDTTVIASGSQLAGAVLRNATLTRVNVSGGNDGIDAWGGAGGPNIVQDSYVHDLIRSADGKSHDDALQTSGGDETFRHNTLTPFTNGDPMNACLQIGALQGNLDQLTFTGNLCDGGNYSINANNSGVGTTVTAGPLTFTDNRFGTDYRYGVSTHLGSPFVTVWSGNVNDADGSPVN